MNPRTSHSLWSEPSSHNFRARLSESVIANNPIRICNANPASEDIYGYGKPFRKAQSYATMVPWEGGWTTATCIDKTLHRSLRHTVVAGISTSSLKQFEPSILENVDIYFQKLLEGPRLDGGWSQARDMNLWSMKSPAAIHDLLAKWSDKDQWLALDTMADFGFGTRIGLLESEDSRFILDILRVHTIKLGVYEQWPQLSKIGIANVIGSFLRSMSPAVQRFESWYRSFTETAISNNRDTRNGILAPVVEGIGTGKSLSGHTKEQMLAEGLFTTFTGKVQKLSD